MENSDVKRYDPTNKDHEARLKKFVLEAKKNLFTIPSPKPGFTICSPMPELGANLGSQFTHPDFPEFTLKRDICVEKPAIRNAGITKVRINEVVYAALETTKEDYAGWLDATAIWRMETDGWYKTDAFANENGEPLIEIGHPKFNEFLSGEFDYMTKSIGSAFKEVPDLDDEDDEPPAEELKLRSDYVLDKYGERVKTVADLNSYDAIIGYINDMSINREFSGYVHGTETMWLFKDEALKTFIDELGNLESVYTDDNVVFHITYKGGIIAKMEDSWDHEKRDILEMIFRISRAKSFDMTPGAVSEKFEKPVDKLGEKQVQAVRAPFSCPIPLHPTHFINTCNSTESAISIIGKGRKYLGEYFRTHSDITDEYNEYYFVNDNCKDVLEWKMGYKILTNLIKPESIKAGKYIPDIFSHFTYLNYQGIYLSSLWKDYISDNISDSFEHPNFANALHLSFDIKHCDAGDEPFIYMDKNYDFHECEIHCDFDYHMGIETGIQKIIDTETHEVVWACQFYGGFTQLADLLADEASFDDWPENQPE